MEINKHKPEEIVTKLRQVEVLVGQGMALSMLFVRSASQNKRTIAGASNSVAWEQGDQLKGH